MRRHRPGIGYASDTVLVRLAWLLQTQQGLRRLLGLDGFRILFIQPLFGIGQFPEALSYGYKKNIPKDSPKARILLILS
jgi:hypothetical protein